VNSNQSEDYELNKENDSGLKVFQGPSESENVNDNNKIQLNNLREISMVRDPNEKQLFQSWIVGVPYILHGVHPNFRKETKVNDKIEFRVRFLNVINKLNEISQSIKEGETYCLKRINGGKLTLEPHKDDRKWLYGLKHK